MLQTDKVRLAKNAKTLTKWLKQIKLLLITDIKIKNYILNNKKWFLNKEPFFIVLTHKKLALIICLR